MGIRPASLADLSALLPMIHAYCDFYAVSPAADGVEAVCRARIEDPDREGLLLVAIDEGGALAGFAALSWKASHLHGGRVAYLYDLFVAEGARGKGHADALIDACAEQARARGCVAMDWLTAPDNGRARAVYERIGAVGKAYIEYELEL